MSDELAAARPPSRIYRLARKPDPWAWPDWRYQHPDGTFGNRWDDPEGVYRVLYASSERKGAFVETLARFRPDPVVVSEMNRIEGENDTLPAGRVPLSWVTERLIGEATIQGTFADVGQSQSLVYLRRVLAARLVHFGISDLDGATIRMSAPKRLTREISRFIYTRTFGNGEPVFSGVYYLSRLGDDFHNWAMFERPGFDRVQGELTSAEFARDDPDLKAALQLLALGLSEQ